jgi:hypothetical protein
VWSGVDEVGEVKPNDGGKNAGRKRNKTKDKTYIDTLPILAVVLLIHLV